MIAVDAKLTGDIRVEGERNELSVRSPNGYIAVEGVIPPAAIAELECLAALYGAFGASFCSNAGPLSCPEG